MFLKCYLNLVRLEGKVFRQLCGVSGVLVNSSEYCLGDRMAYTQGDGTILPKVLLRTTHANQISLPR